MAHHMRGMRRVGAWTLLLLLLCGAVTGLKEDARWPLFTLPWAAAHGLALAGPLALLLLRPAAYSRHHERPLEASWLVVTVWPVSLWRAAAGAASMWISCTCARVQGMA